MWPHRQAVSRQRSRPLWRKCGPERKGRTQQKACSNLAALRSQAGTGRNSLVGRQQGAPGLQVDEQRARHVALIVRLVEEHILAVAALRGRRPLPLTLCWRADTLTWLELLDSHLARHGLLAASAVSRL